MYFFQDWINKQFAEENKVPRILFDARNVAGSAIFKQSKKNVNCVVLEGQHVYSVMKTKTVCLRRHKE